MTEDAHTHLAANALRRFNRYELKYLVDTSALGRLRADLERRMDRDELQRVPTRISSLYYDTRGLRFYWEKIDGLRFRRKLRIRVYGPPEAVTDETRVYVEIKQRVNRVTQKRRVALPYATARALCDDRIDPGITGSAEPFVAEVLSLLHTLDLQPMAITSYFRDGYAGREADLGLRVTIDQRVSGRNRDFDLTSTTPHRFVLPPNIAVVEVKANERVPHWLTDLAARHELSTVRISKYCRTIETFGGGLRAPRPVPALTKEPE